MLLTSRGNIRDLKDCSYPTIECFLLVIQLFDMKFMPTASHSLVVYQMHHAQINKYIYKKK